MQKPIRRAAVQKLRITPQFVDEMQVHNILSLQWAADSRHRLQVFFSCIKPFSCITQWLYISRCVHGSSVPRLQHHD